MRNLKKTLCMVLALVFVLGLCTVGAADLKYSDAADISDQYTTAIRAMSNLGILEGYTDGTFLPGKEVTRGEAAKIIAYMCLGKENADKYPSRSVFDDVQAGDWYAPYVGFCVNQGIINGLGNGKFAPKDPVTQVALAKMLLAACGYGAKGEFTGSGWDFNVADRAQKSGIAKAIMTDLSWDAAATREITSALAYATMMKVNQVNLDSNTDAYLDLKWANGVDVGTYAEATWGLVTIDGVVVNNKANTLGIEGTEVEYYDETVAAIVTVIIDCEDNDTNSKLLGHEVVVQYRTEETAAGTEYLKAYSLEDMSTEVGNAGAANKPVTTLNIGTYTVNDGVVANGAGLAVVGKNAADINTYIMDKDGKLLAQKNYTYTVEVLTVTSGVGTVPSLGAGVTLASFPEGGKTGDLVTVYTCGAFFNAEACTSEKVLVSQDKAPGYNNFAIMAANPAICPAVGIVIAGNTVGAVNLYAYGGLTVGDTITIYKDAEGKTFAWSPVAAAAVAKDYYLFVTGRQVAGAYAGDAATNYAQLMQPDGTIVEKQVQDNMAVPPAMAVVYLADTDFNGLDELQFADPKTASGVAYAPNATLTFDKASFIALDDDGALPATIKVGSALKVKSTTATPAAGATIYYVFDTVTTAQNGDATVAVKEVKNVWFAYTERFIVPVTEAKGTYIYLAGANDAALTANQAESKLVGDFERFFYTAYKDGALIDDVYFAAGGARNVGFYKYKDANPITGDKYVLTPIDNWGVAVADATGVKTGVQKIDLAMVVNEATDNLILNGKLYVGGNAAPGMDLKDVKVVIMPDVANSAAGKGVVASVDGILAAIRAGKTVTVRFVESLVVATNAASISSGVIYVTAIVP